MAVLLSAVGMMLSCSLPGSGGIGSSQSSVGATAPGAAMASWEDFLYVIGGQDSSGGYQRTVWYTKIGVDGHPGTWTRTADLPSGRAFASAATDGPFVYLVGGRSATGYSDQVLFAAIDTNPSSPEYGSLSGFTSGWQTSPRPLPEGIADAAVVHTDGQLVLIGGQSSAGPSAVVAYAPMRTDGSPGEWYEDATSLPQGCLAGSVALFHNHFYLVGGTTGSGAAADPETASSVTGLPGSWTPVVAPTYRGEFPVLASSGAGLFLLGGTEASRALTRGVWTKDGAVWQSMSPDPGPGYGPSGAVIGDHIFFITAVNESSPPGIGSYQLPSQTAVRPSVIPDSGWVTSGTNPIVTAPEEDTVRYTVGTASNPPADPTATDSQWSSSSTVALGAGTVIKFRSFRAGWLPSQVTTRTYRKRSGSLFTLISATISPTGGSFRPFSMEQTDSNGTSTPVSSIWIGISISTRGTYLLRWADALDEGSAGTYTAPVKVSLYEDDTMTMVRDSAGSYFVERTRGYSNPTAVELAPGIYYLLVQRTDSSSGGTFALSLQRKQ